MSAEQFNGPSTWTATDRDTNAQSVATKAAVPGMRHFVTHITVSGSGAPAAAVQVTLASGATTLDTFELPAAAFAPVTINYHRPLRGGINEAITLTCPALGAAIVSNVVVHGITVPE
jgi:hypothetical protein